jgi:hypothetical protein
MDTALPRNMTLLDPSRALLSRELRVVDAPPIVMRAVPRSARTPSGLGVTPSGPGSEAANATLFPGARRRGEGERDREAAGARARSRRTLPATAPPAAAAAPAGSAAPGAVVPPASPGVSQPFPWRARPRPSRQESGASGRGPADARASEGDRDVLRPVFRPLSRPRPDGEAGRDRNNDAGARQERPRRESEPDAWSRTPRPERPQGRPERAPRAEGNDAGRGGGAGAAPAAPPPDSGPRAVPRNRRERQ